MGFSMQGTSLGNGIKRAMEGLAHHLFLLFAISVVLIIIAVTVVGIHPMVIVTALVIQMNAHELGTTNHVLAVLLMLGWSISSVLSPVNPLNMLVSRLSGVTTELRRGSGTTEFTQPL
ncbi:hypothetical protein [Paenibacillus cremeus]|nr:hypothetical protein [Paenibacillus cremeus]